MSVIHQYHCYDQNVITVSSTAIGLTAAKIAPAGKPYRADMISLLVATDSIRYTTDGAVTPTSTVGSLIPKDGLPIIIYGADAIAAFLMIRVTTDAAVNVQYFYRMN